jgi:Cu(I)/Ag(I) efflux system membrane protein CusA/SilA
LERVTGAVGALFTGERPTLARETLDAVVAERDRLWRVRVKEVNYELFDRGTEAFTWYVLEELVNGSRDRLGPEARRFADEAMNLRLGKPHDDSAFAPFQPVREELEKPFRDRVLLWPRTGGPKGDLVDDEMGRVLQVPGWSNIFTQPIINRIEMLSTGVRTDIGVKVFGPDMDAITRVCHEIEQAVKPLRGARDVVATPVMGKGYVDVTIDRERAARYGISVEDVQTEIETALGGRVVTYTVEARERFPVRARYARARRADEDEVKRLLIPAGMSAKSMPDAKVGDPTFRSQPHEGVTEHFVGG